MPYTSLSYMQSFGLVLGYSEYIDIKMCNLFSAVEIEDIGQYMCLEVCIST